MKFLREIFSMSLMILKKRTILLLKFLLLFGDTQNNFSYKESHPQIEMFQNVKIRLVIFHKRLMSKIFSQKKIGLKNLTIFGNQVKTRAF